MGEYQQAYIQDEYYAAVDLGSNSFHMVIVRMLSGSVQIVSKNKQKVRLAAGLDENNVLSQESIARGIQCIRNFSEKLQDIPRANIRIVATATLRLASNSADFITQAEQLLGNKVSIISGDEEARQIYLGVAYTSANRGNTLVIDIGGASTEVIVGRDLEPLYLKSFNMGCVTYMEKYFPDGALTKDGFQHAIREATAQLLSHRDLFLCFDWEQCLGASGTPQAVTSILVKRDISDAIRLEYLHQLKEECLTLGHVAKLDQIEGLDASRQAIFPSGLAILIALFENLNIQNMQISGGALREGIIYGMLEDYKKTDRRLQGINQLINKFHIDKSQSERTLKVAEKLSRQMCAQTRFCNFDTEIVISAAAALHEIGLHIGYKSYHEHGAYILAHTELNGFTLLHKMMIRDLVKLHRGNIDLDVLSNYKENLRDMLINALRVLRIAVILTSRRRDDAIPMPDLNVIGHDWDLNFDVAIKDIHPLIYTELAHESWLQHNSGWQLKITEVA